MTLDEVVNIKYDSLNDSDLYIWRYISAHREECAKLTIEELAKRCCVSRTTVLRFSKKLNLEGFSELKYYLRNESVSALPGKVQQIDLDTLINNHEVMLKELKNKNFGHICEMIENAGRVVVVATGTVQRLLAQEMQRAFLRAGIFMTVIAGKSEMENLPRWIMEDDLVILITLSGENPDIKGLAKELAIKKSSTISITKLASNSVSKLVDEPIYIFSGNIELQNADGEESSYMSLTMFFALIEIMYIKYYNYIQQKNLKSKH